MRQIDVKQLRIRFTGSDRMPLDSCDYLPIANLYSRYDKDLILCQTSVVLVPGKQRKPGKTSSSAHRIFAVCPHCQNWLPVGRLVQHIGYKHK